MRFFQSRLFWRSIGWGGLLWCLFFLYACSESEPASNSGSSDSNSGTVGSQEEILPASKIADFPIGELVPVQVLEKDPSLSVALWIPDSSYKEKQLPLLLAFDSHARGEMVTEKYQSLAEKYGFILAVSNNSRNGMQPNQSLQLANSTIDDLVSRANVDPRRIYLTGFSGGARVA